MFYHAIHKLLRYRRNNLVKFLDQAVRRDILDKIDDKNDILNTKEMNVILLIHAIHAKVSIRAVEGLRALK